MSRKQQRWERLVDERIVTQVVEKTTVDGASNCEIDHEYEKNTKRIVKFATDHAQAVMRYRGKDLNIKLPTYFSSSCIELAVEEAKQYVGYYGIDSDGPLTIEVESWIETSEYVEVDRRLPFQEDGPLYEPTRPYDNTKESERKVVWTSKTGWLAGKGAE